ncbi:hypothetical protein ABEB36_003111 [Hypothenemus hampei]|uniref:Trafficking protein particle complex subunit 12 n=1 Tax=Hypothenemus hampei TaxID=57062 RepID=A0ABD1F823_HYPHA
MSEDKQPSLAQYFGNSETDILNTEDFPQNRTLIETVHKISNLSLSESSDNLKLDQQPQICTFFTETPVEPKDPTASFFDLIGSKSRYTSSNITSELGSPVQKNEEICVSSLSANPEVDRRRNAWIPNERARQVFIAIIKAQPSSYSVDHELLTMPGVLLEEELGDAVGYVVGVCLGEAEAAQRHSLAAEDVTQDEKGLRELVQAGAFRSAINLTAKLLSIYGQGKGRQGHPVKHSPHSLQIWFTRIALLVKTRTFDKAQAEAEQFGQLEKPDIFYQFYPEIYGGRSGSMASFSFRLLLAELPMHCGKPKESLTRLFSILATIKKIKRNLTQGVCEDGTQIKIDEPDCAESLKLWNGREARTMHSVINCAIILKDYELAMELLGQLSERDGAPKRALLSALGRLHLQIGNISGAEICFSEASQLGPMDMRDLVDRGLLAIAQNNFNDAYTEFQKASNLEPSNIMILNNMAVCLLYGGHLKEAIAVLETAISSNPLNALHESLVLNLCTLYDMESSKGITKKFSLLRQIAKYSADAPTAILEKLYGGERT